MKYVDIEIDNNQIPLHRDQTLSTTADKSHHGYDDSRVVHYHDKKLLANIRTYFGAFTGPHPEAMRELQTESFTITDTPLAIVNMDRDAFYQANKAFVSMIEDLRVTAISIDGSSDPGKFSSLECLVEFTMTMDPPPVPAHNLPAGTKKGDHVAMIMLSMVWWTKEGKAKKELEYGRLIWDDFDLKPFYKIEKKPVNAVNHYIGPESVL